MQIVGQHPGAKASLVGGAGFCVFRAGKTTVAAAGVTKGSIEAEVANAVVRFQREQQGRGAADVRAHLLGDLIVVRCSGIFTPTEAHLSASDEGRRLIKSARQELRSINRSEIESILSQIVGCNVIRSYYDVDVDAAEQVEVYVLSIDVEKRLLRQDVDRLTNAGPKQAR